MFDQTIIHLLKLIYTSVTAISIIQWILTILSWCAVAALTYGVGSIHFWWLQCKSNGTSWKATYDEQNRHIGKLIRRIRWLERSRDMAIHIAHVKADEATQAKISGVARS
jgi:hypothetical protein